MRQKLKENTEYCKESLAAFILNKKGGSYFIKRHLYSLISLRSQTVENPMLDALPSSSSPKTVKVN